MLHPIGIFVRYLTYWNWIWELARIWYLMLYAIFYVMRGNKFTQFVYVNWNLGYMGIYCIVIVKTDQLQWDKKAKHCSPDEEVRLQEGRLVACWSVDQPIWSLCSQRRYLLVTSAHERTVELTNNWLCNINVKKHNVFGVGFSKKQLD